MKKLIHKILQYFYWDVEIVKLYPRPMIKFIKENFGGDLVGVEIGVFKGTNAYSILRELQIKDLYLVDPYIEKINSSQKRLDNAKIKARRILSKFNDKIKWVMLPSNEAVQVIPDNLDFGYVDGDHSYKYVKEDIENYWFKIRNGGIIGGHDYNSQSPGVNQAVDEFVRNSEIKLYTKRNDWWVIKGQCQIPAQKLVEK